MFLENRAEKLKILEESLKQTPRRFYDRYPGPYIHTNDAGMEEVLEQIKDLRTNSEKLKLGLIVGTGAVLSVLPELDVEGVIVLDKNPFITEWTEYAAGQLIKAIGPVDFEEQVYGFSNPLAKELGREYKDTKLRPSYSEIKSLGRFHVLSGSERRFSLCQQALAQKKLMTANMSLCNKGQIGILKQGIEVSEGEIVYANFTNIWHWEGSILKNYLNWLPFHPEAIIQFSTGSERLNVADLWSDYCIGLEDYFVQAVDDLFK